MAIVLKTAAQITVTTAGTKVQLSTTSYARALKIYLSAPSSNTGSIWVGDSSVAAGRGIEVPKGTRVELHVPEELVDSNSIYVDAGTSGDKISIAYLDRVP